MSSSSEKQPSGSPPPTKDPPSVSISYFQLFRYAKPHEILLDILGLVAAAAAGAAQPILAILFGTLIQSFVNFATTVQLYRNNQVPEDVLRAAMRDFRSAASRNTIYFVIAGIVVLVCTFYYTYAWTYTGEINAKRIREHYLHAILRQDIEYFDDVGAGEVATRIQSDTHIVQRGISDKVAIAVQFFAAFVVGFILAYISSWRLSLALSSILPCLIVTGMIMGKFVERYTRLSTDCIANAGSITEEVVSTIRTAKSFGVQNLLGSLYNHHVTKSSKFESLGAIAQGLGFGSFFFIHYAAYGLAFSFGTTLINRGSATAADVITVFMAIFIGAFSLSMVPPEMIAITQARGAAAKLFATIDRIPKIDSASTSGEKPTNTLGNIVFENVGFSYPSRSEVPVLQNLSLTFEAGKSHALVGPSGSGKSTVISLMERFYDPQHGRVQLDGRHIRDLNLKWLRRQIGLVSQEPVLFGTSVKNNVAFGLVGTPHEKASEEEQFRAIKQACIKANAEGFIMRLPNGYNTLVGERGFLLSGGQKQRIAIARAIVSDPSILLLDEATSALDTRSEGIVQEALSKAAKGRTTIVIAHRLSTIKNIDKIFVLNTGKVVEEGTHDELMSSQGAYYQLVRAQGLRNQSPSMPGKEHSAVIEDEIAPLESSKELLPSTENIAPGKNKVTQHSTTYLFGRIMKLAKNEWMNYLFGILCSIVVGLVYPAFGVVYALSIDGFSSNDPHERRVQGDRNALWFFIIAVVAATAMGAQNYFLATGSFKITAHLRMLSFKAVMRQDVEFFDKDSNTSGILTSRINGDPSKISGLAGVTMGTIIQGLVTVVVGIIAGLAIVWQLGLLGIACAPFLFSTGYGRLRAVMLKDEQNKQAHQRSAQMACESTAAIRTVASLTREDRCLEEYKAGLSEPLDKVVLFGVLSTFLYGISQAMMFFIIALVFWVSAFLYSQLEISIFQVFVGLMTTALGALHSGSMFQFAPDISSAKEAASDIINLLDSPSQIEPKEDTSDIQVAPKDFKGRIVVRDVHFSYPTRPSVPVLQGLSFTVEPGEYIAFVGSSGSGKSTIIQLLQRFYDVDSGSIIINDSPLEKTYLPDYRRNVALVSQEPTLYSGTIKFNILLGAIKPHNEVTQTEIEEACRNANVLEFIQSLPNGFDTEVGSKGSQLSGGQKQRIAIARAMIRNPKILLLDEATSALDSTSERVVQAALDEVVKGRTTIAIAHRLSTIQNADRIYFIKDGKISESGTHSELLAQRGDYHDYVQAQILDKGGN